VRGKCLTCSPGYYSDYKTSSRRWRGNCKAWDTGAKNNVLKSVSKVNYLPIIIGCRNEWAIRSNAKKRYCWLCASGFVGNNEGNDQSTRCLHVGLVVHGFMGCQRFSESYKNGKGPCFQVRFGYTQLSPHNNYAIKLDFLALQDDANTLKVQRNVKVQMEDPHSPFFQDLARRNKMCAQYVGAKKWAHHAKDPLYDGVRCGSKKDGIRWRLYPSGSMPWKRNEVTCGRVSQHLTDCGPKLGRCRYDRRYKIRCNLYNKCSDEDVYKDFHWRKYGPRSNCG